MNAAEVEVSAPPVAQPLAARGIVRRWKGLAKPVLDGVDLDLDAGQVVAVSGRNGTGKTTLLRIVAGLITADAGTVAVGGLDPTRDRRAYQRRIGFVSAGNAALYARLTVDHHLRMSSRLALLPRSERGAAGKRMLDVFALDELRGRRVDRLSMGQRQRLRLALGFLHSPELVLLDEPENSLDDEAIALLAAAIESVRARGGAVLICSPSGAHDALAFDQRFRLADGRLEPM
jgi:ABC-2 type transport system ATP-binding protein